MSLAAQDSNEIGLHEAGHESGFSGLRTSNHRKFPVVSNFTSDPNVSWLGYKSLTTELRQVSQYLVADTVRACGAFPTFLSGTKVQFIKRSKFPRRSSSPLPRSEELAQLADGVYCMARHRHLCPHQRAIATAVPVKVSSKRLHWETQTGRRRVEPFVGAFCTMLGKGSEKARGVFARM